MNGYQDFRVSRAYQEINPDGSDGSVYWFAIHGKGYRVEVWLMVGDEIRFVESLHGPAAHVRALHIADSWLQFAKNIVENA